MEKGYKLGENMEKIKILITAMSLNVGGAEKSLVNLLNMIDLNKYDVDLMLFQKRGVFLKQVPKGIKFVNVKEIEVLYQPFKDTLKKEKFSIKNLLLALCRVVCSAYEKIKWKQFDQIRIHRWLDFYSKWIPSNERHYDVGVSFAGGETAYYLVDKVNCDRKVYFFHSDYSKINIDAKLEEIYVNKVDQVVTISEACKVSLQKLFPLNANKVVVLNNLNSSKLVKNLSKEFKPEEYSNDNEIKIVSVGRLHEIKGYDMAIEAASILKKENLAFKWYVVGEGDERAKLEKMILRHDLKDNFLLLGLRENPYPYVLGADVLVQPSRFEGKSVVLDEAKILGVPIVVTNYNSVHDQVKQLETGVIVDMDACSIAQGVKRIIEDKELYEKIKSNILKEDKGEETADIYLDVLCGKE